MLKGILKILIVFAFMTAVGFTANAVCEHSFEYDENRYNLKCNEDMTHSFYCLNGCGSYGTVEGGEKGKEECSFSVIYEKDATCTRDGTRLYMCTVCYRDKEENIPKGEHTYVKTRRLPTCTQGGCEIYICSGCGDSYSENPAAPLSHVSDGGIIEHLPTTDKQGIIKFSCRVCGALIERKTVSTVYETPKAVSVSVTGFKVKSSASASVKLIWTKNKYALSYKIFYSTDKKKWKSVSADGTSVTVKGLKSSQKYYFKITAVCDGAVGTDSKIISAHTCPGRSTLVKVTSSERSAFAARWKKLSGVSGYEISYSPYSFGKKKDIRVTEVSKGTSKTVRKLKSGKKYYVRIRAYKKSGAKKIYGPYSEIKTVKIK